jgi:acyl carrier protein
MDLTAVQKLVLESLQATDKLGDGRLTLQTDLGDIDFDSLALIAVAARFESQFDVEFSVDQMLNMYQAPRIADLAQVIESSIAECRAASGKLDPSNS